MATRKRRLANLRIDRVALVARGSNPHADIVFFKSEEETDPMKKVRKFDRTKLNKDDSKTLDALIKKMGLEESDEDDAEELTAAEIIEGNAEIKKMIADAQAAEKKAKDELAKVKKTKPAKAEVEDEDEDDEDAVDEKVLKSLPEPVRKALAKAEKLAAELRSQVEKTEQRAKDAEANVAIEKAIREETEGAKKLSNIVKAYSGDMDSNSRVLYRIRKAVAKEDFVELEKMLNAGNAALAQVGKEIGRDGDDEVGRFFSKAADELKTKAEELMAADSEGKLTYAKAFTRACEMNPALVKQYRKEKKDAERGNSHEVH